MAADATAGVGRQAGGWTPARIFMAASAVFHVPVAIIGLAMGQSFQLGAHAVEHGGSEHIFGILESNGWHSLGALLVGVISLYFAVRSEHARAAALALGVGHVILFLALTFWDPSTFGLMSNGADQVVHASTAIGGIGSALLTSRPRISAPTMLTTSHEPPS
jgi:Domain of unknown function (DUF4383)